MAVLHEYVKRLGRDVILTKCLKINVCCKYSVFSNFVLVVWKHTHPSTAYMFQFYLHQMQQSAGNIDYVQYYGHKDTYLHTSFNTLRISELPKTTVNFDQYSLHVCELLGEHMYTDKFSIAACCLHQ